MQPLNTETSGNFLPRLARFWGRSLPSTNSPESPRAAHIEGHPSTGTVPVHASEHFICLGGSGRVAKATPPELCAKSLHNNFGWTGWSSSLCVGLQLGACMVLGEVRGKDKTRSFPSDGFKAATCTVAGECMGRVYIQSVYPWTSGERGQDGSESSGKGKPRKAGRTRPGCSGNEGSDHVEKDPHELLAKEESFS